MTSMESNANHLRTSLAISCAVLKQVRFSGSRRPDLFSNFWWHRFS